MTNAPLSNSALSGANLRGAVDLSSLVRQKSAPGAAGAAGAGGRGADAAQGGIVRESTDATFTEVLDLSATVPVIVEFYGQGIEPTLGALVAEYAGRIVLATVDGTKNPQLVQAFQVQQVPTVAAVVGGRPVQLFVGMLAERELRDVIDQVLALAEQNGVNGTITVDPARNPALDPALDPAAEPGAEPGADASDAQVEPPLPPHHQEAYDAITAGDFAQAVKEYETAIAQNPRDQLAVAGLAQVSLLARLDSVTADSVRAAAAAHPQDVSAALDVADLDVADGKPENAFGRLLDLFPSLDAATKNVVRIRIIEYFEIIGADDQRVIAARRRLTGLLY